jgi:tetratricopeptide (TPR) repeat protein
MDPSNFKDLRDLLAFLYPDVLSIRRIIDDAGIGSSRIDISETAVNSWHFVLIEAEKINQIGDLLNAVKGEYGTNERFQNIYDTYHLTKGQTDAQRNNHQNQNAQTQNDLLKEEKFESIQVNTGGGQAIFGNINTEGGDFVSRDKNIYIGSIKLPRWLMILTGVFVILIVAQQAIAIMIQEFEPIPSPILTQIPTLTPSPTPLPLSSFNIAITSFQIIGDSHNAEYSRDLAETLIQLLEEEVEKIDRAANINFVFLKDLGPIAGNTLEERASNAQSLAKQINANIVIYGIITINQDWEATVKPEFYVSRNDEFDAAAEIVDHSRPGLAMDGAYYPIVFSIPKINNITQQSSLSMKLGKVFQVLTEIMLGLSYYTIGESSNAEFSFQSALSTTLSIEEWKNNDLIYVMLGNALGRQLEYQRAEESYNKAIKDNPLYSRAYIGLGETYFMQALGDPKQDTYDDVEVTLLDKAATMYQQALAEGMEQPPLSNIAAKAHFGLGRTHFMKIFKQSEADNIPASLEIFSIATDHYRFVIDECKRHHCDQGADFWLQDLTAQSYANLGLIHVIANDLEEAATLYKAAIELLPSYADDRRQLKTQYTNMLEQLNQGLSEEQS